MAPFSHVSVKHRAVEFEKSFFNSGEKVVRFVGQRAEICQMDTRQCGSKAAMSEFDQISVSLPTLVRPRALGQRCCSSNYNVQQNIRILKNLQKIGQCVLLNIQQFIPGETDCLRKTKKQDKLTNTVKQLESSTQRVAILKAQTIVTQLSYLV